MRWHRPLLLAALAAVLGFLAGAGLATTRGSLDDSPMTVPVGKIGDELLYATFVLEKHYTGGVCEFDPDLGTRACRDIRCDIEPVGGRIVAKGDCSEKPEVPTRLEAVLVDRVARTLDRNGTSRDALVVRTNESWLPQRVFDSTRHEYFDLGTRNPLRTDESSSSGSVAFSYYDETFDGTDLFWYQGKTFRLGDEVPLPRPLQGEHGVSYLHGSDAVQDILGVRTHYRSIVRFWPHTWQSDSEEEWILENLKVTSRVDDRRYVQGYDAYAIRMRFEIDLTRLPEFVEDFEDPNATAWFVEYVVWVADEVAYPVAFEERGGTMRGSEEDVAGHEIEVLSVLLPGSSPIPWRPGAPTPSPTRPERTEGNQLQPSDGTGSRVRYRLSEAMGDAQGPLAPLAFKLWQRDHPGSVLVSAQLMPGEASSAQSRSLVWHLVYATPDGAGFEITPERASGSAVPAFPAARERPVPRFSISDFPRNPLTVAAAERLWSSAASRDHASREPNFVHWGFDFDFRPSCWSQNLNLTLEWTDPKQDLRVMWVGHTEVGSCLDAASQLEQSALLLDTQDGVLLGQYETRDEFTYDPTRNLPVEAAELQEKVAKILPRPPEASERKLVYALQAPRMGDAVLASATFLAIFLTVYFLPALSFAASKAWIGVAGYAKLRREEILDNKIRDQILQVVRNDPGITTSDLARRVDAGWGTVVYHLSVLERNNMVSSLIDGRFHRFFPVGVIDFSARGQVAVLKNERTKLIYELIDTEPGIVQEVLARRVGISAPAAIFHLKRLEEVGMVGRVKKGRKVHYYTNEKMALPPSDTPPLQGMEFQ